ncbi:MAG: tRNA (adenosine(37)-N6)-dimethylallyltransferase MiaA [Chloroflexi bacterium]|nr:tRNA (adenosine(37)-N6)-dimethylallyltransferase MiaA [Chloroflexota bacterium]|tara:strand:- start:984 stop:1916 length:933 start_codon:yes stop_codon:yes gene_type:complete
MDKKNKIIVIVGATASGKSSLGIKLANHLSSEIINADSRLFYRGLNIGTAKPTKSELSLTKHHLIDILDPDEKFTLNNFLILVRRQIEKLHNEKKTPIIIGGSGQYIWSLIEGWNIPKVKPDTELRSNLENQLIQYGIEHLQVKLKNLSEKLYEQTDLLNPRRIIRSIEIAKSSLDNKVQKNENLTYDSFIVGLNTERKILHSRVRNRVNKMLNDGFIEEINTLIAKGYDSSLQSMSSIGYKEFINYVNGEYSKEEAIQKTIISTNRLIRNQNNWFKQSDDRIFWINNNNNNEEKNFNLLKNVIKKWIKT